MSTKSCKELYEDDLKDYKAPLRGRAQLEKAMKQFAGRREVEIAEAEED